MRLTLARRQAGADGERDGEFAVIIAADVRKIASGSSRNGVGLRLELP